MLVVVKLTDEFTSLEEPTDDSDMAIVAVAPADGSDFVGSERRIYPEEPMRKFRLPIAKSISCSNPVKIEVRVGG
jgi:hypothetical protein